MTIDGLEGLDIPEEPSLKLGQEVTVVKGKHKGKTGKAHRLYFIGRKPLGETPDQRLELIVGEEIITVKSTQIDFKFEEAELILYFDDDERAEFLKRIEENYYEEKWEIT
jgi:hypothetical protein